jgi:hypothetical protein
LLLSSYDRSTNNSSADQHNSVEDDDDSFHNTEMMIESGNSPLYVSSPNSSLPVSPVSSGGWLSSRNPPFNGIPPIPRDAPVFVLPQHSVFVGMFQYLQETTTILDGTADVALYLENGRRKI